jgi:uncharacterized phage-associated protein
MRNIVAALTIKFDFNSKKGVAFLEALLQRVGGEFNYMALLKLAFFADRYHVRHYARPVSGDVYYAMKLGPVPSNLKDIIDVQDYNKDNIVKSKEYFVKLQSCNIDISQLSKSDIKAIDFAVEKFGNIGRDAFSIAELTHAYPEWNKYWAQFEQNRNQRIDMDYKDFLKNTEPNHIVFKKYNFIDPFVPLTESERQTLIEEMEEISTLYG